MDEQRFSMLSTIELKDSVVILIISIIIFCKTINYAIYEIKVNSNKSAGITIIIMAFVVLIFAPFITLFR